MPVGLGTDSTTRRRVLPTTPYEETRYDSGRWMGRPTGGRTVERDPRYESFQRLYPYVKGDDTSRGSSWGDWAKDFPGGGFETPARVEAPRPAPSTDLGYARYKDRAALSTQGALKSLQAQLRRRGMLGSDIESARTADIVSSGARQLSEADLQNVMNEIARQDRFSLAGYEGEMGQRGQDISAASSRLDALLRYLQMRQSASQWETERKNAGVRDLISALY